jgi:hypothetical protein
MLLRDLFRIDWPLLTLKVQAAVMALPMSFTSDSFDTLLPSMEGPTSDVYDKRQCILLHTYRRPG